MISWPLAEYSLRKPEKIKEVLMEAGFVKVDVGGEEMGIFGMAGK